MEAQQPIEDLLAAIAVEQVQFNRRQQPPLSEAAREELKSRVAFTLSYELPQPYFDILSKTDGLDSNGVVLYASQQYFQRDKFILQGFLEANLLLRGDSPNLDFIYFAESGMDLYRHHLPSNQFEVCTRVGLRTMQNFATAADFFVQILADMLDAVDDEDEDER